MSGSIQEVVFLNLIYQLLIYTHQKEHIGYYTLTKIFLIVMVVLFLESYLNLI